MSREAKVCLYEGLVDQTLLQYGCEVWDAECSGALKGRGWGCGYRKYRATICKHAQQSRL